MKKLLIVSSDTIHVYNYLKLIEGYFDEVLLLTNRKNPDYQYATRVLNFSLRNPLNYFRTTYQIRKAIQEFKPDVIHVHQANSYAYFTFRAAKGIPVPKVLTAWGSDILLLPSQSPTLKKMVQFNIASADAITSDSSYMAEEVKRLEPSFQRDILIANFGINVEPVVLPKENIIYSNRLHKPLYRIDKIIKAFSKFISESNDKSWKLVIAATGEETENLKTLTTSLNIQQFVEFAGWVDKQKNSEYYAKAKFFVSIPESDATSISLLEAMAFGCLPVVSDLPANREWIKDGVNGIVVKNMNDNFLAEAFSVNLEEASAMNKKIIEEHGTKEANRKKFFRLYDQLLKK
ncbi:MAG: glycosyltransferase [Bacteroidia bacterium]